MGYAYTFLLETGALRRMLWVELSLVLLATMVALLAPELGCRYFNAVEKSARLARPRRLAAIVVGATAIVLRLALLRFRHTTPDTYFAVVCLFPAQHQMLQWTRGPGG
jgi:hypothetical protein